MTVWNSTLSNRTIAVVLSICLSLLLSLLFVPSVNGQPRAAPPHGIDRQYSGRMLSMNEAIAIAKRRHKGEVLGARRSINRAGNTVYVIKMLTARGVVRQVRINARQ